MTEFVTLGVQPHSQQGQRAFMKRPAEYLEQAAKYDDLVARAPNKRRKREFEKLADVYRYLADEASRLAGHEGEPI